MPYWAKNDFSIYIGGLNINNTLSGNALADRKNFSTGELACHLEALDSHAITATTDITGTIIYANSKFSEISGYSNEELVGQNHRVLNSGYHPKSFFREMFQTISNGNTWKGEIKNRAKDGSFYWVDTTISPLKDSNGKIYRYISIRTVCTKRKQAEEKLKRHLNILDTTFTNFPGGICVFTKNLKLQSANPAFYRLLEMPEDSFPVGSNYEDIIRYLAERGDYGTGDIDELVENRVELARVFEGNSFRKDIRNGRALEIRSCSIPEGGFIATHMDVTDIDGMIAKISLQNLRFNAALDNISHGLSMFDGEKRLIVTNKNYVEMYGLSNDLTQTGTTLSQILEHRIASNLFSGNDPEAYIKERNEWISSGVRSSKIQALSDGRKILISHMPMSGGGWLAVHEDVTERKKAEAANLRLAKIVEHSLNEVFVFDTNTFKFLQVNDSARKNLGYTNDEMLNLTAVDLKPEFSVQQFEEFLKPLRRGDKDHIRFQTVHRRKDGSFYDVDIILQEIHSENPPVFAAIVEDITDRKKAKDILTAHRDRLQDMVDIATLELKVKAEELTKALSREKELNELQRKLVSMASHEFRTPLTIIDGAAQLLIRRADKVTAEEAIKRSERIRAAVRRMTQLMESTLSAARMQEGKVGVKIRRCKVAEVVESACRRQQEISPNHIISWDLKDLPDIIQADAGALDQIFTNLLSNAVKYAPGSTKIDVVGCRRDEDVTICVRDQGIGIDKNDLSRIGERFFRAKTSTGTAGTGIGLNLVKILLELHNGSFTIDSEKGCGSTFSVRLPISGPEKPPILDANVA